jgi:serine/threonine protein phosphatase PrpC
MPELIAFAATDQDIGARHRQEDSVLAHAADRNGPVLAVLSDGMGGHDDGDLASRIIASKMFSEMFVAASRHATLEAQSPHMFRAALNCANLQLRQHIDAGRLSADTGGTLVCVTIHDGRLRWVSVGDSPLYLFREGRLRKLNQIHSMAEQLDLMVSNQQIDAETAQAHPDRNCLTSAITGCEITKIDCPDVFEILMPGDIVLLASDGLNALTDEAIAAVLAQNRRKTSSAIAQALLNEVAGQQIPDQDNTSIVAIKIERASEETASTLARFGHWMTGKRPRDEQAASLAGQRA